MDHEHNTQIQVDPSTNPMSAIQAFKMDPSNEWVIESAPGFVAIKHKMGCPICDASASHCMAAKWSYEICLAEKDVSHAVAEAWPKLVRYQDDYYHLLEVHNILKESLKSAEALAEECRAKTSQLYDRLDSRRVTIQNLTDQVQSLEKELQEAKDNSAELSCNEDQILKNKCLKRELDYYNGYHLSDIPVSDGEDDNEDPTGLPTIPEDIPQYIPVIPPNSCARLTSKKSQNDSRSFRIIANPPASITGVLPKLLGKSRAERWDQPAFRGASEWIVEQDVHDAEMRRLYAEAKALPHHQKLDTSQFAYWANEIASLKGGAMNHFCIHDDLLPLVQGNPFYSPPTVGEPMDQDEPDPEPIPIQHTGLSSLADRLDYGEGGSFFQPPADTRELWARISYFDSLVPQGTVRASTAELSEELTRKVYTDNLE
ncbi:hypothetical protein M422DRAFT_259510 [Sphaerobolus stellatus SS14]|uniref:Uncharacterized protein n=1 Tax=Sphaerobolus stellatus (strain SS14) TaxID=990650 RepID=A0A0C9VKD8_SPHS4|nr:hypothetical protein M422DRAFT_259510 [Sphaerobolus stellatus SS14]